MSDDFSPQTPDTMTGSSGRPVHPLEAPPPPPPASAPPPADGQTQQRAIRVERPSSTPYLTYTLLAINIIVFVADFGMGRALTQLGAKANDAIVAGEYWRLITPMFLHGGLLHLGFNSYFLYIMGPQVERNFGKLRFLAIYFLSGVGGAAASFALNNAPSIGASGALFGLIGAMLPFLYHNRGVLAHTSQRIRSIIQVIVINLLLGLSPGIDNWGHVGGLVTGVTLAWFLAPRFAVKMNFDNSLSIQDESSPVVSLVATGLGAILLGLFIQFAIQLRSGSPGFPF